MTTLNEEDKNEIRNMINDALDAKNEMIHIIVEKCINKHIKPKRATTKKQREDEETVHSMNDVANFGTENYDYILMPTLSTIIKNMSDFHAILQRVVTELYFNIDKARNHIVYIPRNAYKSIKIFHENNWKIVDLEPTLEDIIRRANDVLQHYLVGTDQEENMFKTEIGKKKFEGLKEFTDMIDNMEYFSTFRHQLLRETEHTIVTSQHLVHKDV